MQSSKNGKNTSDKSSKNYFTSMTCTNFKTNQNILFAPLQRLKNDPTSIANSPLKLCKSSGDNSCAYNSDTESTKRNKLKMNFLNEKETFERKQKRMKSVKMVLTKRNEESKQINLSPNQCKYTVKKTNYDYNVNYEEIVANKNENKTFENDKRKLKVVSFNVNECKVSSPIIGYLSKNCKNVELIIDIENYLGL